MLQMYKEIAGRVLQKQVFLTFLVLLMMQTSAFGQKDSKITIQQKNMTVIEALKSVERQTKMSINYSDSQLKSKKLTNLNLKNALITTALDTILKGTGFTYQIRDNYVIVTEQKSVAPSVVKNIRGKVVDENGEPLIGVNISVEGSSTGTITDMNGSFMIKASDKSKLKISYIGYATQMIAVSNKDFYQVVLKQDAEVLDEVVVTALGIKRAEKALSYNVQQVKGDELTTVKDANFISSLNGKVAGVTINSSNSTGGASRVVMRGVKSITSSNLALYVIDGVPMYNMMNGGNSQSVFADQPGTDGAADINPEDIESISMLTGPSAAALYGNAAAAGVVLITTKKGSVDKTSVTVSNNTTFSKVAMMPEMQSKYGNVAGNVDSWGPIVNSDYDPRDFFRTGSNVINSVALSTGNQKNQSYLSASTTNTTNILPNSGYNRYNFTVRNTTSFLKDKMTLDAGASYILQNDKNMVSQGYYYNPLPGLYRFPRSENFEDVRMFERYNEGLGIMEQYWPYGEISSGLANPYWVQNRQIRENKKTRYMVNASLKYQIFDWLDVTGRVKIDNYENRKTYKAYASTGSLSAGDRGTYHDTWAQSKTTYADAIATVNKNFSDWSVNVNLGVSLNDSRYESIGYEGGLKIYNFFAVHNLDFDKAWKPKQEGWHDQTRAIFANAELGWKSMLYLTVTGRNDWDSRLAFSDYKSFFYPSVGLSAILTSMFDTPEWLSFLKVRGSYTEVGNSYDRFMTTVTYPYDEASHNWNTTSVYPNTKLKPERTKSWEVGVDARFLNDISFNLTYYRSNTYNQTFHATLSASSGYSSISIQSGNIMNEGIEMSLGYDKKWGDFSFNTNYTLTWNRNEIKQLADGAYNYATGEPIVMPELDVLHYGQLDARLLLRVGGSMGDVYGQKVLKRDLNGYILNEEGVGLALENKETHLGSILPKMNMGWNLGFGYKGINLGMTFTGRFGGIVLSETQSVLNAAGVSKISADVRDAGGVPINQAKIDARNYFQTIQTASVYYTYSATNVRLGELSLSYTLPKKWFANKLGMTVGLVGKNLWMIYCKAPFDPELTTSAASNFYQGFDAYMLPSTRNFGFNVKFQF